MTNTNHKVSIRNGYEAKLSNSAFHRSGGNGSGAAHWWLRDTDGNFVKLPSRVRGDKHLSMTADLTVGSYVLGTGRGADAIRQDWDVTASGEWV